MRVIRVLPDRLREPIALTIGNFDGVHIGHQAMLGTLRTAAAARGLAPWVMIFEPQPREYFDPEGAPPRLSTLVEKLDLLAQHGVEHVLVCRFDQAFAGMSPDRFVTELLGHRLNVRWLLVGDDFRFGARRGGNIDLLRSHAGALQMEVAALPSVALDGERVSSTVVRTALAAGDMERAARYLGRPYAICGRVAHGRKLGRTIGFPTANVLLKRRRAPVAGIFAVQLRGVGYGQVAGVASLGTRPTIEERGAATLEVHLFDFDASIYGLRVAVDFLHKLRDEEKYPDLETLTRQIRIDADNARAFFAARGA